MAAASESLIMSASLAARWLLLFTSCSGINKHGKRRK